LVLWLEQLSRYRAYLQLDSVDPYSPLARSLHVEFRQAPGYTPENQQVPDLPFEGAGVPTVEADSWIYLRVENHSTVTLKVGVLDFTDSGKVFQVWPAREDTSFFLIEPGGAWLLSLQLELPPEASTGYDIVKVIGTVPPTSFRWLELPELGQPVVATRRSVQSAVVGGSDALERFLAAFSSERPETRELHFGSVPTCDWVVAQAEIRVQRTRPAEENGQKAELQSLSALSQKVSSLYEAGKYAEAIEVAIRLSEEALSQCGENHPEYANAENNLGLLYYEQERFTEAGTHLERALSIRRKLEKSRPLDLASSLNNVAALHRDTARYTSAEQLYQEALRVWKDEAKQPSEYSVALLGLATLYGMTGRLEDAEEKLGRALQAIKSTFGEGHPSFATAINNLAALKKTQGNLPEAEALYRRAVDIISRTLGAEHPKYANLLNNLAMVERAQGRVESAERHLRQALNIQQRALGSSSLAYAATLNNLAGLYKEARNYPEAASLYEQALEIRRSHLEEIPRDFAASLTGQAEILVAQGKSKKADKLLEEALAVLEKNLDAGHAEIAVALRNLAANRVRLGLASGAAEFYRRALKIDEAIYGPSHLNLVADLEGLETALAAESAPPSDRIAQLERIESILTEHLGKVHALTRDVRRRRESLQ
jgi:tetratricopeptide (TPR) repeat protein